MGGTSTTKNRGHQWLREHEKYAKIKGHGAFYCRGCHALYPRPTSIKYHLEKGSCKTEQKCTGDHEHEFETQFIIRATGKGNVYYECNRKGRPQEMSDCV